MIRHKYMDFKPYNRLMLLTYMESDVYSAYMERTFSISIDKDWYSSKSGAHTVLNSPTVGDLNVLWVQPTLNTQSLYSTIYHEAIHAAFDVLDGSGVEITVDNNEPLAYGCDLIFHEFWDLVETIKKKEKASAKRRTTKKNGN